MPKSRQESLPLEQAWLCHARRDRAARPEARKALNEEWKDWLALAEREHARRIHRFRAGFDPAPQDPRCEGPRLQRVGRPAVH